MELIDYTLLYVEDDTETRKELSQILKTKVKNFFVAKNGAEGLKLYKQENPDIVLTDVIMPVMDGLEMSKKIKEIDPFQTIIILTAYKDEEIFKRTIDIGVNKFISKPILDISYFLESLKTIADISYKGMDPYVILDQSNVSMVLSRIDNGKNIAVHGNKAFLDLYEYESKDILGKDLNILHRDDKEQSGLKVLKNAIKNHEAATVVLRNYTKDKRTIYIELSISPIFEKRNNKLKYYLGVQKEITEEQKILKDEKLSYEDLYIVGIGASAGGFESIQKFLGNLPKASNISYVIAQHLDPNKPTLFGDLLSRNSPYEVMAIKNGQSVEAEKIYFCPYNNNVIIKNGRFILSRPPEKQLPKPSINIFLSSLASEKKEKAIAIILSGSGSDGAKGIESIAQFGGITLSEDEGAKYYSMPKAAIDTGKVSSSLPPELLADGMIHVVKDRNHFNKIFLKNDYLHEILEYLNSKTNIDFTSYKEATISRRIKKRMNEVKLSTLEEYSMFLKKNQEEVTKLKDELLIIVTSFFRDKDAFLQLKEELYKLVKQKLDNSIRIWIPGCATGEEAYSVAILINEILHELNISKKTTIFATDISDHNITESRMRTFTKEQVEGVDKKYLDKYFMNDEGLYKPIKQIRDLIVFSKHDIVKDPPFLNIDLISCRNLLIYFNTDLQKRVLSIFYYALRYESLLFLGKSETTGTLSALFTVVDSSFKIYKKSNDIEKIDIDTLTYVKKVNLTYTSEQKHLDSKTVTKDIDYSINQSISKRYASNGIVIDGKSFKILYYKGDTREFINQPIGMQTNDIFQLISDYLKLDIRATINEAKKTKSYTESKRIRVLNSSESREYVIIKIHALEKNKLGDETFFISFSKFIDTFNNTASNVVEPGDRNKVEIDLLEDELVTLKERLQITIEELETSNEELQSTNEELQSTNEELQSTNEELETSNEELQSTNEEIQTVNDELVFSNMELEFANKAFNNVLANLGAYVLIMDKKLNIIKYTEGIIRFFNVTNNFGTNFSTILLNSPIDLPNLMNDIKKCMKEDKEVSYDIDYNNRVYSFLIKKIDISVDKQNNLEKGIVLSFIDKTEIIKKERLLFQQSKLASMGEMIGNIAHQWRQPLNILGAEILKHGIDCKNHHIDDIKIVDDFEERTGDIIQKMSTTIDDFRSFFNKNKLKESFDIKLAIDECINFVLDSYKSHNIEIINNVPKDVLIVAYKNELIQVILNILNNSKDAIIGGEIKNGQVCFKVQDDKENINIVIEDNGGGIKAKIIEKVFEPYFTTKFKNNGTGIGLYMSKMIIEESLNGKLELENINGGLRVIIKLRK